MVYDMWINIDSLWNIWRNYKLVYIVRNLWSMFLEMSVRHIELNLDILF